MNPYAAPTAPPQDVDKAANAALLYGLASILLCAPVTASLAFWKARQAKGTAHRGRVAMARALAALGLLSSVVLWFVVVWSFFSDVPRTPR